MMTGDATAAGACADLLITNAAIVDGSGAPRYAGAVAIAGERILRVGRGEALDGIAALARIDAGGCALAPGFIDVHTHDDSVLLERPEMTPKITQGVTTVIAGNCGISLAPLVLEAPPPPPLDLLGPATSFRFERFADYAAALESAPAATNAALMVGHSTLRVGAMDEIDRPANGREIDAMCDRLAEALAAGAVGFSTGLYYPTNRAATMDEVVALLGPLAGTGAIYATHMRDEGDHIEEALEESFETAARAGVPLVISHHKCTGERNFGRSVATLARIEAARARQEVGLDVYPYTAGSTVLLPEMIEDNERIMITWSKAHPEAAGRDLAALAADWGCDLLAAARRLRPAGAIYFKMDEADVRRILAYPHTMVASDGLPLDQHPHPRLWGAFARVLGHYVREVGLLGLEDAVYRMTGLPAARFGLTNRGHIRAGAAADLVLFDPDTVIDRASFEDPMQPAAGIDLVLVNGQAVLAEGRPTGARPGRLLRRSAA